MYQKPYEYADPAPYPEVTVCGPNGTYARAMLANIGACSSEISAVTSYFYNSLITRENFEEISECYHKISVVEMHHLDIFGQLALLLGADPRLWSQNGRRLLYWSPSCNSYGKNIRGILENSLKAEKNTIEVYKKQTSWIKDESIVCILNRIILDEICHVRIFEDLYSQICQESISGEHTSEYIRKG